MEFPSEGEPVITTWNDSAAKEVELPTETAPEPEVAKTETTPPPTEPGIEEAPPIPAKDWAAILADLTPEEASELVKSNPLLKRRVDGEIGSRLQQREAQIRAEAAAQAIEQARADDENFAKAWSEYEEIESWRDPNSDNYDPDRYEKHVLNKVDPATGLTMPNAEYPKWVSDLFGWKGEREAAKRPKPQVTQGVDKTMAWKEWNDAATRELPGLVQTNLSAYQSFPGEVKRALTAVQYDPEGNWMDTVLKHIDTGYKAHTEKKVREAAEAARIAGRNEALAERTSDTPVMVNNQGGRALNHDQVIQEHAFNGYSTGVTEEQLKAAYKAKGLNH